MAYLVSRNFAAGTLRGYRGKAKVWAAYLAYTETRPLDATYRTIEDWQRHLRQEEKSPKGIRDHVYAVGSLYRYLKREGLVESNPCDDVDPIRLEEKVPHWWTVDEVARVIAGARSPRDRAILETLYSSGGRASEVQAINVDRLVLDGPEGTGWAVIMGKGAREGLLHLMPPAVAAIRAWLPERAQLLRATMREHERALFLSSLGRRLSYCPFRMVVLLAAGAAGIPGPAHPHMLRHSMATHNLDRGANLREVQEMLRHRSIKSTERYTHIAQESLVKTMLRTHPGAGARGRGYVL